MDNYYFDVTIAGRHNTMAAVFALRQMVGGPVIDVHAFTPPKPGPPGDWSIQGAVLAPSVPAAVPMLVEALNLWPGDLEGPPITRLLLRTGEQFDSDFLDGSEA